jgi:xanthine dehydrogenase accessory factor
MTDTAPRSRVWRSQRSIAVILGTNEIASAVAVNLAAYGYSVILSHDPFPPLMRRAMAFHDALFDDRAVVEAVLGERAETRAEIASVLAKPGHVAVTPLHLTDLIAMFSIKVLVDARMQKHRVTPDFRGIAATTIGLGPHFAVGVNCDIAVETRPAKNGTVVRFGRTDLADGIARPLGGVGAERFVYSDRQGRWHTPLEIGTRVFKGIVIGRLDGSPVLAPIDGVLRGLVRDSTLVPSGVKLLEIDTRGRNARWTGTDQRGRAIAEATLTAIRVRALQPTMSAAAARLTLI